MEQLEARRHLAAGAPDLTFGDDGRVFTGFRAPSYNDVSESVLLADGSIIAVGRIVGDFKQGDWMIARYTPAGRLDPAFGDGGILRVDWGGDDGVAGVAVQDDGKLVVHGIGGPLATRSPLLVRHLPDGSLDPTFGQGGVVRFTNGMSPSDVAIDANGRLVLSATSASDERFIALRYNADGSPDDSFGAGGTASYRLSPIDPSAENATSILLQDDGKILLGGSTELVRQQAVFGLMRLSADGSPDDSFGVGGRVITDATSQHDKFADLSLAPDGKIVAVGESFAGTIIVRYGTDGTPDPTFGGQGIFVWEPLQLFEKARSAAAMGDGSIVLGVADVDAGFAVAKITPAGQPDPAFGSSGAGYTIVDLLPNDYTEYPVSLAIRGGDDPSIVVAAVGKQLDADTTDAAIVSLSAGDGRRDTAFGGLTDVPGPTEDYAGAFATQTDGKIVAAGRSSACDSCDTDISVARYNPDGSLDTTFGVGGRTTVPFAAREWNLNVYSVRLQPDGKILLVGSQRAISSGGNQQMAVARLNSDGSLDATFGGGDGQVVVTPVTRGVAYDALVQRDGRLVLVGEADYPATAVAVHLNPDGSIDTAYGATGLVMLSLPANSSARVAIEQPGGKHLVGGIGGVVRYNPDGTVDPSFATQGRFPRAGLVFFDMALDAQRRIILLEGRWTDGKLTHALTRLSADGAPDASFGAAGSVKVDPTVVTETWVDFALDRYGRFVLGGTVSDDGVTRTLTLRLLPDGSPDPRFGTGGIVTDLPNYNDFSDGFVGVAGINVAPDDDLLLFGYAPNPVVGTQDFFLLKYDTTLPLSARAGGAYEVAEGADVFLSGSGISNWPITTYEWDLDYDGVSFDADATGQRVVFSAASINGPARRRVALRVTDASGASLVSAAADVHVLDTPYEVTIAGPARADAGVPYEISLAYANPAPAALHDPITSVTIDWGDGSVETLSGQPDRASHTYSAARAVLRITVRVTDADGTHVARQAVVLPGTVDPTLAGEGYLPSSAASPTILPLPDGGFIHAAGNAIFRHRADGTPHTGFGVAGRLDVPAALTAAAYAVGANGELVVAGTEIATTNPSPRGRAFVARYRLADGAPDTAFGTDGVVFTDLSGKRADVAQAVAVMPDGRITLLAHASIDPYTNGAVQHVLLRLNPDGTPDRSYGQAGVANVVQSKLLTNVVVTPSGRAFVAMLDTKTTIMAFRPDGSRDTAFANQGNLVDSTTMSLGGMTVLDDGRLVLGYWGVHGPARIYRFRADGTPDPSFGGSSGAIVLDVPDRIERITGLTGDATGGVVILGTVYPPMTNPPAPTDLFVARVTNSGALDAAFADSGIAVIDLSPAASDAGGSIVPLRTGQFLITATARLPDDPQAGTLLLRIGDAGFRVSANNTGPIVAPGALTIAPAERFEGAPVTLAGTITDPDAADAVTVAIDWGDGSADTVLTLPPGQRTFSAEHVYAEDSPAGAIPHAWPVRVTVDDGLALATSRTTITVENAAPLADAGPDVSTRENQQVRITGRGSDASPTDARSLSYRWTLVSGASTTVQTGPVLTFFGARPGLVTATLTVTDPDGGVHADVVEISVADAPPVANLGGDRIAREGEALTFTSGSTIDVASRQWTVVGPDGAVLLSSTAQQIEFHPPEDGRYTVHVTVTDEEGSTASDSAEIIASNANPILSSVGPLFGWEGAWHMLTLSAIDPGVLDVLTYRWELLDAQSRVIDEGTGPIISRSFDGGTYLARWTITDDDGGSTTTGGTFVISEVAPELRLDGAPSATEGSPYVLQLSATDPGPDTISGWTIDWGDGSPQENIVGGATVTATHVYRDGPAVFNITATASDEDGSYTVRTSVVAPLNGLDRSFNGNGFVATDRGGGSEISALVVQPDGAILTAEVLPGWNTMTFVRHLANGVRDASFASPTFSASGESALALLPDGRLLYARASAASGRSFELRRLLTNGFLDTSFGTNGVLTVGNVAVSQVRLLVLPDGRFYVAGRAATGAEYTVSRFSLDGSLDPSFGTRQTTLPGTIAELTAIQVQADGKLLLGGAAFVADRADLLVRYNPDGTPDASFGTAGVAVASPSTGGGVVSLLPLPDGRTLVGGIRRLVMFRPDGSRDLSFGNSGVLGIGPAEGKAAYVLGLARDPFGRYLVATSTNDLLRLRPDFTPDPTFAVNGKATLSIPFTSHDTFAATFTPAGNVVMTGRGPGPWDDRDFFLARITTGSAAVSVLDVAPTLTLQAPATAVDGTPWTVQLADSDPGLDRITNWRIDWGDGSPLTNTGSDVPSVSHVFVGGTGDYVVRVTAINEDGLHAAPPLNIAVNNPPPSVNAGRDVLLRTGAPFTRTGAFSDPGDDSWTATVDFGDGTERPLTLGTDGSFDLAHAYAAPGLYTVTVSVRDDGGGVGEDAFVVTVRDAVLLGTPGDDAYVLRVGAGGDLLEIFENAPPTGPPSLVLPIALAGTIGIGGSGGGADTIEIIAGALVLEARAADDHPPTRTTLRLRGDAAVTLPGTIVELAELELSDSSRFALGASGATLRLGRLSMSDEAVLDLRDGRLSIPTSGDDAIAVMAELNRLLRSARSSPMGAWSGPGITSSVAASDSATGIALGEEQGLIVARYSHNGDANLDGRVNADDYFRIDQGFLAQPQNPSYSQGDFNYDGRVNADDYFLIDQAFLGQGGVLVAPSVRTATAAATTKAGAATKTAPFIDVPPARSQWAKVKRQSEGLFSATRVARKPVRAAPSRS